MNNIDQKIKELENEIEVLKQNKDLSEVGKKFEDFINFYNSVANVYDDNLQKIENLLLDIKEEQFANNKSGFELVEVNPQQSNDGILIDHTTFSKIVNTIYLSEYHGVSPVGLANELVNIGQNQLQIKATTTKDIEQKEISKEKQSNSNNTTTDKLSEEELKKYINDFFKLILKK